MVVPALGAHREAGVEPGGRQPGLGWLGGADAKATTHAKRLTDGTGHGTSRRESSEADGVGRLIGKTWAWRVDKVNRNGICRRHGQGIEYVAFIAPVRAIVFFNATA